ncbi:Uncharacterised protein [Legionella wadsworthii]|uniref:Uncharacterized protein n=1 Tax=Legionella wadsworthii TaxID=28088 RepID=A0A378LQW8_9GAMM|nr:hypothetical protein [Legionella wadsworthii]STY29164.1 Uncharacterised protein [Legionella wadsworthii]
MAFKRHLPKMDGVLHSIGCIAGSEFTQFFSFALIFDLSWIHIVLHPKVFYFFPEEERGQLCTNKKAQALLILQPSKKL